MVQDGVGAVLPTKEPEDVKVSQKKGINCAIHGGLFRRPIPSQTETPTDQQVRARNRTKGAQRHQKRKKMGVEGG